jgi:uncharacterized peroxidase-related enzyme
MDAQTRKLLDLARAEFGLATNMMKTMAQSPAALEGYLNLSAALANGSLEPQLREAVGLAVAHAAGCEYSIAAHASLGRRTGLTDEEIIESSEARSSDPKIAAALKFAHDFTLSPGALGPDAVRRLREAGWRDPQIVELVALAALQLFGARFNRVAGTIVDFPKANHRIQAA